MATNQWPYDLPRSGNDAITRAVEPIDQSVFREYDIRGRIALADGDAFTLDGFKVGRIGRAFGTYLARRSVSQVAIGYDARSYSEPLANSLILGLLSNGVKVINIGLATTPMLYFAQHHLGGVAGISVTASHNPNGWAGLKLSAQPSITLGPTELEELLSIVNTRQFDLGTGSYVEQSVTDDYIEYLATRFPAKKRLRVVVDGGNSIAGPIAHLVLEAAGYEVLSINRDLDWTFPNHEPDPETVEARKQIEAAVRDHNADAGISLDGDGDRMGLTDEQGAMVWSDQALAILAEDVLRRNSGVSIVYDVKCSRAVEETITKHGGKPVMWMTGHSHIKTKMREIGAPFAGERSGHFFDAVDYLGYDDGIYAALKFLQIVSAQNATVSGIVSTLPQFHGTPAMQAECADSEKYSVVDAFGEYASTLGAQAVIRINGVRAEFPEGWLLLRASSNLPALVIVAEADSEQNLKRYYDLLRAFLDQRTEVSRSWLNDPWQVG